jgi:hypothetical protein
MDAQITGAGAKQTTGLIDIQPPSVPPSPPWHTAVPVTGLAALLVGALVVLWRRRRAPRHVARRRLARLRAGHARRGIDARGAAYEVAAVLRAGLGVRRLAARAAPSARGDLQTRWADFIHRLDDARYAPALPSRSALEALFADCAFWLGTAR